MRRVECLLSLLVISGVPLFAQQEVGPTLQDGPLAIANEHAAPKPDADGVYRIGPGIATPTLVKAAPAAYPASVEETDHPHIRIFAVVVGADGVPSPIKSVLPNESKYDAGAMDAIRQSVFQAGTLNGKPVPVLVHIRVPFFHLERVVPEIQDHYTHPDARLQGQALDPLRIRPGDTPPKVIYGPAADFSEEARANKINGSVRVSLVVSEQGLPTELKVEKSLGYGLDEKALEAVHRYRFKPAMRDGKAVPVRINIQVQFKIY